MDTSSSVKWDTEALNMHINSISSNIDKLRENKDFLLSLNTTIDEAWKGIAGTAFGEVMDIDIENYKSIISDLELLTEDLRKAVNQCYVPCEEEICSLVNALVNRL